MKQLILILLLFSSPIFAQSKIDSIIENKTQELKSIGIKNYFFYNTYCIGSKRLIKIDEIDCSIEGAFIYLFWQEENKMANSTKSNIAVDFAYFFINMKTFFILYLLIFNCLNVIFIHYFFLFKYNVMLNITM